MKPVEMYITSALGALSILMVIALITISKANQGINQGLAAQQNIINKGKVGQQVGQAVLRDMATASLENEDIKNILTKHGFNVNRN